MVNIMWTSDNHECCPNEAAADIYFQRRVYLGVYPMAPLPAADHCIGYNATIEPWYVNYGSLFAALQGKQFNTAPHAVSIVSPTARGAVANAFVRGATLLYPVALVPTDTVTLEARAVPMDVSGFEAIYPGDNANAWKPVYAASKSGLGVWQITIHFADKRPLHAAVVRSVVAPTIRAEILDYI